jgi:hypothetical protein
LFKAEPGTPIYKNESIEDGLPHVFLNDLSNTFLVNDNNIPGTYNLNFYKP